MAVRGEGVSFGLMQCSLARLSFSVLWVLSTTAWLVGYVKGMAYPPGSEELVELLGTIIRVIISLYGPRHPHDQHDRFKDYNSMGGLFL